MCPPGRRNHVASPPCEDLERDVAAYCGVDHAVGCASCSDALLLALMAHEIAGDPISGLKWTRRTTERIAVELRTLGIDFHDHQTVGADSRRDPQNDAHVFQRGIRDGAVAGRLILKRSDSRNSLADQHEGRLIIQGHHLRPA